MASEHLGNPMDRKKAGDLDAALTATEEALRWAETALSTTRAKKIRSVSATLARKQGTVQSRKPREPVWTTAVVKQDLVEQERLRTLAASRVGVLFVDGSEIRLDENSLAVIGEMKENVVRHSLSVHVMVLKGDILAQLSSLSGRKRFSVAAPGVTTRVRSTRFRYRNIKCCVSGSVAAALRWKSMESGAGRFTNFLLPPLTFPEYLDLLGQGELVEKRKDSDSFVAFYPN